MEHRILHSADIAPLSLAMNGAIESASAHALASQVGTGREEIVFVDTSLPDAKSLIADLEAQRADGRPLEIVTFGPGQNGIAVITDTLAGQHDIGAVHILSHGADGLLQLGDATLDEQNLAQFAGAVASWGAALAPGADLMLYGCDVAQSAAGKQFVSDLAALTGADVAASTGLTGAASGGGNWTLEYHSGGPIHAQIAISTAEQAAWQGEMPTYTVTSNADTLTPGTLRYCIYQANLNWTLTGTASTINVPAGVYTMTQAGANEVLDVTGDYDVYGNLTINGANAATTVINANGLDRLFNVHSGVLTLNNLTLEGGQSAANGGAINVAAGAGLILNNDVIQNNSAANGGAIANAGSMSITAVAFTGNSASADGGAIYGAGGSATGLNHLTFSGNSAQQGGAIYQAGASMVIGSCGFLNNTASQQGGAIDLEAGTFDLSNSTFTGDTAVASGGALYIDANASLENVSISGGTAQNGGAIYQNSGTLTLASVVLSGNTATHDGGAIASIGGTLTMSGSEFDNNVAANRGGGLIASGLSTTLSAVTFNANQAKQGGGVYASSGTVALTNVTLSGNAGTNQGGGVYAGTTVTLLNVTLANNTSGSGGGVYTTGNGSQVTMSNTLFSANSGGNANKSLSSGGNNLSTDSTTGAEIVVASAGLAALADNGGGTLTCALLVGSAAINAGNTAAAPPTDQRNVARAGAADIGAYEYNGVETAPTISAIADQSVAQNGSTAALAFTVGDSQSSAATLTVSVQSSNTALVPSSGLVLGGSGANRTLTVTPAASATGGPIIITLTVSDSVLTTSTSFALTVSPTPQAPVLAQPIANQSATQGTPFAFTLPAGTFTDPNTGGTLTYTATLASGAALPAWLSFNGATRTFSGTPASGDVTTLAVNVTATDTSGTFTSGGFSLGVAYSGQAPVQAQPIANQSATQGASFTFTVPAGTFTDPNTGGTLSYSATLGTGAALPAWLTFNNATRTFSGTPGHADVGSLSLSVTATDNSGAAASGAFSLGVIATAPTTVSPPPAVVTPPTAVVSAPRKPEIGALQAPLAAPAATANAAPASVLAPEAGSRNPGASGAFPPVMAVWRAGTAEAAPVDPAAAAQEALRPASAPHAGNVAPANRRSDATPAGQLTEMLDAVAANPFSSPFVNVDFQRGLDQIRRDLHLQEEAHQTALAQNVAVAGGFSVGYALWLLRGGVLVSSMLSALPAWQMVDPIPVLAAARKRRKPADGNKTDDPNVERLFDANASTGDAAVPAAGDALQSQAGPKENP
jgi:predicted outer membrane repeat protein